MLLLFHHFDTSPSTAPRPYSSIEPDGAEEAGSKVMEFFYALWIAPVLMGGVAGTV